MVLAETLEVMVSRREFNGILVTILEKLSLDLFLLRLLLVGRLELELG